MKGGRDFIKKGVIGGAGIAMGGMELSAKSYASIVGANARTLSHIYWVGGGQHQQISGT